MKSLSKEILNYYATYTETRFNHRQHINYKWTNSELTLDLSLFPEFQLVLLEKIKKGDLSPIVVKKKQYTITIPKELLLMETEKLIKETFNKEYLEKLIYEEFTQVAELNNMFQIGDDGGLEISTNVDDGELLLARQKKEAQNDGIRTFNIKFRRQFESLLYELQEKIVKQKKDEYNIEFTSAPIFGVNNYVTQHLEQFKRIADNFNGCSQYINEVLNYFSDTVGDIDIYDLYYNVQNYSEFFKYGSLFTFFHMLEKEGEAYPLFFTEIKIDTDKRLTDSEVILKFPRNLMMINTPAVNYFKFDSILTAPRASLIDTAKKHLGEMEAFIQSQYGFQKPFILEPIFPTVTHAEKKYPLVKNRIGFQIIKNEDKKLLDYSELMTRMEAGKDSRFSGFIDQYIQGKVPNHQEEVDSEFKERYHRKNPLRYVSQSPIPMNNSQKRILLALAQRKNHIIVVDGPPGTGKSHTISAITYWANEQNKSVVITSHKKEALDVIDRMLTEKYKQIHPQAKPSIVRMDKETGSVNNLANTLTNSVIGAANERALDYNEEAVKSDQKKLIDSLTETVEIRLNKSDNYENIIRKTFEFETLDKYLKEDEPLIADIINSIEPPVKTISFLDISEFIKAGVLNKFSGVSLEEYGYLIEQKDKIPDFLEACEKLNQVSHEALNINTDLREIPIEFAVLLEKLVKHFKENIPLSQLTIKHTKGGFIKKF